MHTQKIALIGAGNMARALIGGLRAAGMDPRGMTVADPVVHRREEVASEYGVRTATNNPDAARNADLIVLAVKPQDITAVLRELQSVVATDQPLVLSVAAGIRTDTLVEALGGYRRVIRAMPNRPALLGRGITALYAPPAVVAEERARIEEVLRAVGHTVWVEREEQMDAVTAVSGSGPAYFFLLMELLEQAARELGLSAQVARKLSIETAYGAACMARGSHDKDPVYGDPAQLRTEVTSRGGTTEAALAVLSDADLRDIVRRAVAAAAQRSAELANQSGKQ